MTRIVGRFIGPVLVGLVAGHQQHLSLGAIVAFGLAASIGSVAAYEVGVSAGWREKTEQVTDLINRHWRGES